jgi:hypothetical protein
MSYRSAITGKFVSAAYAKRYPKITVREKKRPQGTKLGKWIIRNGNARAEAAKGRKR